MVFNKSKHLIKVQGNKMYLPVSARLLWFREEHKTWGIETEIITLDTEKQFAICKAIIKDETGRIIGEGIKREDIKGFGDYLEKASTGAIGRALAVCGYGTDNEPSFDEGTERFVDSPRDVQVEPAAKAVKAVKETKETKVGTGKVQTEEEDGGHWTTCAKCQDEVWMDTTDSKNYVMLTEDGDIHACELIEEVGDEPSSIDEFADDVDLSTLLTV